MAFHDYRTAGRIRVAVRYAQLAYLDEVAQVASGAYGETAVQAAQAYAAQLELAAAHLAAYPRTAAFMDLGVLSSPAMITAHAAGVRETSARWQARLDESAVTA